MYATLLICALLIRAIRCEHADVKSQKAEPEPKGQANGGAENGAAGAEPEHNRSWDFCESVVALSKSREEYCKQECKKLVLRAGHHGPVRPEDIDWKAGNVDKGQFYENCALTLRSNEPEETEAEPAETEWFVTNAVHRRSWTGKDGSCHCAMLNAEPCTEADLRKNPLLAVTQLANSEACKNIKHLQEGEEGGHVALAGNKMVRCPKSLHYYASFQREHAGAKLGSGERLVEEAPEGSMAAFCALGKLGQNAINNPVGGVNGEENQVGKGHVFCKQRRYHCRYNTWSKWSECNADCRSGDKIATQFVTRAIVRDPDESNACIESPLGAVQIRECANLTQCKIGELLNSSLSEVKVVRNFEAVRNRGEDRFPKWVRTAIRQYPELATQPPKGRQAEQKYVIRKTVKKTTLKQVKCGCPMGQKEVGFAAVILSKQLMVMVKKLCREGEGNKLAFENNGRYVYHCGLGEVIKEREGEALACDDPDNTEYMVCGRGTGAKTSLSTWELAAAGVLAGVAVMTWLTWKRKLMKRRRKAFEGGRD